MTAPLMPGPKVCDVMLIDCRGKKWHISGDGKGDEGIELSLSPEGLLDAPVTSLWQETAFGWGAYWAGLRYNKRELVLGFNVLADDAADWASIESNFRRGWSYLKDSIIRVTSEFGTRELTVRLSEATQTKMERDPRLWARSNMVITCAAGWPFWRGPDVTDEWELTTGTAGSGLFKPIENKTDMPQFPIYSLDVPGTWTLPDFSFGSDEWDAAEEHVARTIVLPPLEVGTDATVNTDPTEETLMCDNASQKWALLNGEDFLYPIPPGEIATLPIAVTDAVAGVAAQVRVQQNFQRAWGLVG